MATNYPNGYDSLTNPTGTDALSSPAHASQHADANDAIEAIQATLGLNPEGAYANVDARLDALVTDAAAAASSYADASSASAGSALASAGSAAAAAGTAYSYQQGAETNANQAALSAGSAYTSMLAAAESESAAAISAGAAATSAASIESYADLPVEFRQFAADGSVLANLPARVHPAEQLLKQAVWWIDAAHSSASGQSVSNLGWGGSALDAQLGSTGSADSNDPKYLDWDGENYVYLPGVAGNYLSVPDEAALDITGDIDIRVKVALDDWTPGSAKSLVYKDSYPTDGNRSFGFEVGSTGTLVLAWSPDGTTASRLTKISTAAVSASDGATIWVRATLDADNGAAGSDVKFWTSDDGVTWTQLGSTVTTAGATSIFAGTAPVNIGAAGTIQMLAAKVHRAQILNGIDGTPVLDIDCSQIASGADTSFTALTGQTVTINRSTSGRKTVGVVHPRWLFGTDDYLLTPDSDLLDFNTGESITAVAVWRLWNNPSDSVHVLSKAGSANSATANTNAGWRLMARRSGGGNVGKPILYLSDGLTGTSATGSDVVAGTLAVAAITVESTVDARTANSLLVGRWGTYYADMEFTAAAIWRRALTSGEIATLNSYFQGREGA